MPRKVVGLHGMSPFESSLGLIPLCGASYMGQAPVHYHRLAGTEDLGALLLYFLHTSHQTVGRHTLPPVPQATTIEEPQGEGMEAVLWEFQDLQDPSLSPGKKTLGL